MLDSYAERVRFVRSLTKLSREAFENKYSISRNTLKSWELGINTLTEKSAIHLAEAIKKEGFSCSPEWLIFGIGSEPRSLNNSDDSLLGALSEQTKIIYEANYFQKNNENSIIAMITDNSMSPNFCLGDYVGGIFEQNIQDQGILEKFIGHFCIINLINGVLIIRRIIRGKNNLIFLYPNNIEFEAETVTSNDVQSIACIIWHRSTFKNRESQ